MLLSKIIHTCKDMYNQGCDIDEFRSSIQEILLSDEEFLNNVCLSYRHDYGLLSDIEKDNLKTDVKLHIIAIVKSL